ncbi:PHB depolymerase family esterase [Microbispora sp. RL4-1S]|uniref:PHB depolymerase family esterase n=1 Tax=Microbispora oryzae TaxID=2806554 RepID=A0A941AIT6_9ACTN|nr:PHB depolymerase family esterase [Microbispora oryzae]MBP2705521.1 PHB depolymerase family esterase [Microbispora oryzae]
MKRRIRTLLAAAALPLVMVGMFLAARPAAAATMTRVTNFGNNPTNLNMYIYVPNNVAPRPALLVLVHYCSGSASGIFNGNGHDFVTAADRYGYIIVLPEATRSGSCFDVSTSGALKRDGGSDSTGIMSMVSYARQHYNIDSGRIVVSGFSSGAMMTNVLAAEYPDVFSAASAYSGVPAGCFATTGGSLWNSQCSGGQLIKTAQQWGDQARAMYPGYTGPYPRIQLWHGTTDTTLAYPNFGEEIKQWTNLHGLSQTPSFTDHPQSTWTRTRYGGTGNQAPVEGISISGVGHQLPMTGQLAYAITFLGLDGTTTASPSPSASPTRSPSPSPSPSASPSASPSRSPSPSPSPSSSPSSSPTPQGPGGCTATYRAINSWPGGFQAEVTVANGGSTAINGWTVRMTLASGQSISSLWNGVVTGSTGTVSVQNAAYNGTIAAGGTTTFGFTANGDGAATPTVTCSSM